MRLCLLWILCACGGFASDLLIGPEELQKQLPDPKLVLLHVGTSEDYDRGHIPGARLVVLTDLAPAIGGLRLQLLSAGELRDKLLALGVDNESRVVIYAGNDSVQSATRVWFSFEYLSRPARLLNGGLAGWKKRGYVLTGKKTSFSAARDLTVKARPELLADAMWIESHRQQKGVAIVDARLPEFYTGANAGNMPRAGRIPGARNVPFPSLLTADKEFLPVAEIEKLLPGQEIAAYCHIGMQATVVFFSARLAGRTVRLYDGSFEEWSSRTDFPVEVNQ
jgi:thiosulfate/3-mercaptopyruvate sulfurtransferase